MQLHGKISIVGKRPLMFHRFSVDAIPLEKKEKSGVAGNDPEEWKKTVLVTKERQLYIEDSYIFGCLRDAGKHTKVGRGTLQSKIASTLVVMEEQILLDRYLPTENELTTDKTHLVYLDIRGVKNPVSRARNVRYRIATRPGWKATFNIEWDGTVVNRTQMKSVLNDAGALCGLGDGRSIGNGRFEVEEFLVA
ncbi:hypothetical protein LCGC14_1303210 [marine sediment metagenome]|uniref:CRISPR-associated RAMP protein n=1 Tax=marine sediment metagenome TaxID=412755 RepID=A0A0F9L9J6_9ZZZZ